MTVDNNYCFFVYKNVYIERYNQDLVKTSACCLNQTGGISNKIQFIDDVQLSKQRAEMQLGQRPKGCVSCWNNEDSGTFSYRNIVNRDAANFVGDPYQVELLGIDYNVSPICNAKCIMCSSLFSSSWAAEDKKFGIPIDPAREYSDVRHNQLHKDLDLSHLNRIYFNGGEPLLSDEPLQILQHICTLQNGLKNLRVSLNSNGSVFPDKELLQLWSQCESVILNLSIDACGDAFEYIRYPLAWHTVQDVVHRLIALPMPRLLLTISATVGMHNFLELDDLQQWIDDLNQQRPQSPIELILQGTYGELALHNTSEKFQLKVKSFVKHSVQHQRLESLLCVPRDAWAPQQGSWLRKLQELDQRRGQDWKKSLPRLADFVEDIENYHAVSSN